MTRNLLFSLMLWLLEGILEASFVSDQWSWPIQLSEDRMLIAYLGVDKEWEIRRKTQQWFDTLFIQTGVRDSVYRYFIPTERERQMSKGFGDVGRYDLFRFIQSRLNVLWGTVYQMIKRLVIACTWLPFLAIASCPFAIDGLVRRKISQTNFDYPSPMAHRYSIYTKLAVIYLQIIGLTLPFPVPPQAAPIAVLSVTWALNVLLANTQKRV